MSDLPLVSVLVPVRDESRLIARCLEALLRQSYPTERYEVIVADGGSVDPTPSMVDGFRTRHPNLTLIANPGKTAAAGLNAAFRVSRGEIIVRVDGHCEVAPDYLLRCVEHLQSGRAEGVGGPIEAVGETPVAAAIAAATSSAFGVGDSAFRTVKGRTMTTDTVPFPAYARATIERAGPYDEELVRDQDDEFNYRLRKLGARLLLAADVRSRYFSRGDLGGLVVQYFQYGFWKVRVMQKHPRQMSPRQFVPPLFVLALVGAGLLDGLAGRRVHLSTVVGGAYLAASVVASLRVAMASRWAHLPLLPVVFAALHLSYGAGFLAGLVRFARRWPRSANPAPGVVEGRPGSSPAR